MEGKSYIEEGAKGSYSVGFRAKGSEYVGPVAEVYAEREWLYIVTDPYEGVVMLNIETPPKLQTALARIAKSLRSPA